MSKAFAVVYICFVGVLVFGAVGIWRIRCEGFGCTGVGIAWLAWGALFVPSLAMGLVLGRLASLGTPLARLAKLALWVQVAAGTVLLAIWVSNRLWTTESQLAQHFA